MIIKSPLVQRLWTWSILAFARAVSITPLKLARPLGRRAGWLAFYLLAKRRRVAMENLELAYGDELRRDQRKRIAREAFMNYGVVAMEFAHLPKLSKDDLLTLVEVRGLENIDHDKGAILVSSHTANWELMAPALAARGYPLAEIVNTYRDPQRGQIFDRLRKAGNIKTVPKNLAATIVPELLEKKMLVGIMADQSARQSAVPVTLFGRACWSTAGPAILALRQRIPVYIVNLNRRLDGTYLLDISEPVHYEWTRHFRSDLCGFSQVLQDAIEVHIRNHPGQWLWMHNRWKERPELALKWADYLSEQHSA